ncbi:hypothetical protein ACLOJK_029905 [Asimina triloba]
MLLEDKEIKEISMIVRIQNTKREREREPERNGLQQVLEVVGRRRWWLEAGRDMGGEAESVEHEQEKQ